MRVVDLARACGSVLGRQGNRFAARLTSFGSALTASARCRIRAAMIDALLRGRLPPRAFPRANLDRGGRGQGRAANRQGCGLD